MQPTELFKKLVHGYAFGELPGGIPKKEQEQRRPVQNAVIQGHANPLTDMYPIIRKGKVVGWGRI